MDKMSKYITRYAPAILWGGMIIMLSSIPGFQGPNEMWWVIATYLAHFFEYLVFSILVYWAVAGRLPIFVEELRGDKALMVTWLIVIVFGSLDEIYQGYVPGKQVSIWDFLTDTAGVVGGLSLLFYGAKKIRENIKEI